MGLKPSSSRVKVATFNTQRSLAPLILMVKQHDTQRRALKFVQIHFNYRQFSIILFKLYSIRFKDRKTLCISIISLCAQHRFLGHSLLSYILMKLNL